MKLNIKNLLIFINFSFCGYARLIFALRCESPHLPIEEVRQVLSSCTRKLTSQRGSNSRNENSYDRRYDDMNHNNPWGPSSSSSAFDRFQKHENLQPSYFTNASTSQEETTRACILQCFFEEFKMVNHEGFPDKRKMAQVLTKDTNWELRNFYLDSIDQCFRILEYESRMHVDKCSFSRRLVDCLIHNAKIYCSDWDGEQLLM